MRPWPTLPVRYGFFIRILTVPVPSVRPWKNCSGCAASAAIAGIDESEAAAAISRIRIERMAPTSAELEQAGARTAGFPVRG
jgi:hypothetical protein